MTLEQPSINDVGKTPDAGAGAGSESKSGDNLGEFRLARQEEKSAPTGESMWTAEGTGALVSLASPRYGPAMRQWADAALPHQLQNFPLTKAGEWLDESVLRKSAPLAGDLARETQGLLNKTDWQIARGLASTALNRNWVPEQSMAKAALIGAGVGLGDWAASRELERATGVQAFQPNFFETAAVTGAAISPIPGRYKVAAIALGVGIGKLSNLAGLS
ncbi:MAG TPA: hypothetical protein V6C69_09840 [Trichormus sp.]|jgi:hypothetical protein